MPARADHPGKAWCYKHECPPDDCFELHNPTMKKVVGALSTEEHEAAIVKAHIAKQRENFERNIKAVEQKFSRGTKAVERKNTPKG